MNNIFWHLDVNFFICIYFFLNGPLNKLQDLALICFIWINYDKEKVFQSENFQQVEYKLCHIMFTRTYAAWWLKCWHFFMRLWLQTWAMGHVNMCVCNCVCVNSFIKEIRNCMWLWQWTTHDYNCQMLHGRISHKCFKVFGTKFPKNNKKIKILELWKYNYKYNYEIPYCNMWLFKMTKRGSTQNVLMN